MHCFYFFKKKKSRIVLCISQSSIFLHILHEIILNESTVNFMNAQFSMQREPKKIMLNAKFRVTVFLLPHTRIFNVIIFLVKKKRMLIRNHIINSMSKCSKLCATTTLTIACKQNHIKAGLINLKPLAL